MSLDLITADLNPKKPEEAKQIAAIKDGVTKFLGNAKAEKLEHTLAARWAEQERVALSAEAVGVSAEDYHKWASGRPMPKVAEAVKAFVAKR